MTEEEYKQKIDQAFANKNYSDVIELENNLVFSLDSDRLTAEQIYPYFCAHNLAPIFVKKGLASLQFADAGLAGRSFEDAIRSLAPDGAGIEAFFYLAFVQAISGYEDMARETIKEGLRRDPKLLDGFDGKYDAYLASSADVEFKQVFKAFCSQ